jgi:hypothetical protein
MSPRPVAPIRVARHTLDVLPQGQARRCRWNPSPAQFGNASRRRRITVGTKSQRNRGPGTSRWHRPLSSEGTSERRQYPWLAEQPVMHGRRRSVLASESRAYRRLGARSPRPCPLLSVAFYRRSRCGVTRPWRSWWASRPSMLLSNGAAVASRSRLTRARPMRHERVVVLFAADGHPCGHRRCLGGVHPTRHGTVRC